MALRGPAPLHLSQLRLNPSNGDISRSETSQLHKPALVGDVYAVLKKKTGIEEVSATIATHGPAIKAWTDS
jgi:hypothetical protein